MNKKISICKICENKKCVGRLRQNWALICYHIYQDRIREEQKIENKKKMKKLKRQIREKFKKDVFERDHYKCIMCKEAAKDAHHIVDRSLWPDGGYHVDNGVSLCSEHHLDAESGKVSCNELRKAAGIRNIILPASFDSNCEYDKWGNKI